MTPSNKDPDLSRYARRLIILFGLVYFCQGIGQHVGLISQPLQFFFKQALGLNPAQVTEYLAILTLPWTIKPLYGLVSDYIPLFGYRRKTWLLVTNALAASGFLWLFGLNEPTTIVTALMLTAFGTAASDVIIDAVMVENGKKTGMTANFQSVQWLWMNIASVGTSLFGGYLCTVFEPGTAVHVAAMIAMCAPLAVMAASWLIVREEKTAVNLSEMKATTKSLFAGFKSKTLWAVIAFLAFWNFSPSFGSPWYYHQTDTLLFSQAFIGILGAVGSAGQVLGAIAYGKFFAKRSMKQQLIFSITTGTIGTLAYLLLLTPTGYSQAIAIGINLVFGAAAMIATLATLTLAAQACPPKAEGFTFAALMSVVNGFAQVSAIIGARLYVDVFHSLLPLILISAAFTFACILLLPILRSVPEGKGDDDNAQGPPTDGDKK
ncbi:MAG: MFS transporter [Candidatus Melainabacteria bacterium]|nr:MFS transporter [Candidatus Melainabacteria bacterium]